MRHVVIRFLLALVWIAALVVCVAGKNMSLILVYGFMSGCFVLSAVQTYKKEKNQGDNH